MIKINEVKKIHLSLNNNFGFNLFLTAYAWLKCERQEDKNCYEILEAAGINGSQGSAFGADNRYVRLSLISSQDDFEILINKLKTLIAKE